MFQFLFHFLQIILQILLKEHSISKTIDLQKNFSIKLPTEYHSSRAESKTYFISIDLSEKTFLYFAYFAGNVIQTVAESAYDIRFSHFSEGFGPFIAELTF